ncbi:MAG TPA: hypothetical protein VIU61_08480 [Kofleriaceae bacterium]
MKKAILVLGVVVVAVVSVWKLRATDVVQPKTDGDLVLDRVWLDHLPTHDKDVFQIFLAITEQPFGVFQASSQWTGKYEIFRYESHGDEMRIIYPQNNDREKVKVKARRCSEQGMDYCLEIEGSSRGVKKYYSQKGWEIDGELAAARDRVDALIRSAR